MLELQNNLLSMSLVEALSTKISGKSSAEIVLFHIDYENYDDHQRVTKVVGIWRSNVEKTVDSYHNQGIKKLTEQIAPMACDG